MKIDILYGNEVFVLPKTETINKLSTAEMIDLKFLLLISSDAAYRNDFNPDTAATVLKCTKGDIESSLKFWIGAGVIKSTDTISTSTSNPVSASTSDKQKLLPESNERPSYTGKEIGKLVDENKDLKWLINECQGIIGKLLNTVELNKIVGLVDYLRLDHEHILMLFIYCKNQGKVSVHYVEKMAYNLYDEGIDTLAKFEVYVKSREAFASTTSKLRNLFGFGDRTLTAKENEYFSRWCLEWIFPYEIIQRAYEVTIDSTNNHKLSLAYLNKVLDNWYSSGYKTLEEIDAAILAYRNDKEKAIQSGGSFDTDEFFELAVKRGYEAIEKDKEV